MTAITVAAIGNPKCCRKMPPRNGPITSPKEYMHDQTPATKLYVVKVSPHPPSLQTRKKHCILVKYCIYRIL